MSEDSGTVGKVIMTLIIVVMMIPGLIIEPGPLSEIAGLGALGVVWGFGDLLGGDE